MEEMPRWRKAGIKGRRESLNIREEQGDKDSGAFTGSLVSIFSRFNKQLSFP